MPEFDDDLSASIASAKAKLAEREQARMAAESAEREKSRALAERFAEVKSRAMRFKHNQLEPLFRKLHQKVSEAGFHFIGNYINDEESNRGTVGNTLECGERCYILAAIRYDMNKSLAIVEAQTPKETCHSARQEFDEATALKWFEANLAEATGKLLASGEVPTSNAVLYNHMMA